jgi:serine/threonine-protein kinase RsbT
MNEIAGEILAILRRYLSEPTSRSLLTSAARRANLRLEMLTRAEVPSLVNQLGPGLNIFLQEPEKLQNCKSLLALVAVENVPAMPPEQPVESRPDGITVPIRAEHDIVRARTLGKDMAKQLGFSEVVQTKVATAVSELARNIFQYAGTGEIRIRRIEGKRRGIEVVARDQGPGISDPALILSGAYRSKWGMGAGLRGTKRLVDEFELDTHPGLGTTVRIRKYAE